MITIGSTSARTVDKNNEAAAIVVEPKLSPLIVMCCVMKTIKIVARCVAQSEVEDVVDRYAKTLND